MTTKKNAGRYSQRTVPIGNKEWGFGDGGNNEESESQKHFIDNEIRTSKYRWYTFLFK